MTTERRKWWRKVAMASVGGTVVVGGLFGIVRATAPPEPKPVAPLADEAVWTRSPASAQPVPAVAEVDRTAAPSPGTVVPASATLAVPLPPLPTFPAAGGPVVPAAPAAPAALPPVPVPSGIEPVGSGPRAPDAGLIGSEKLPLPPVPALPSVELPKMPAAPKAPEAAPIVPPAPVLPAVPAAPAPGSFPALPPLPGATAEPPKAPTVPPAPVMPVVPPAVPGIPPVPQNPEPALPVKSPEPVRPVPPVVLGMPDSGLKRPAPENTLNPSSPVAPAVPIGFPPTSPGGREVPGTPVDRPKPTNPSFGSTDKFKFPVPDGSNPLALTPRDSAMFNFKHAAAAAVIGGAMLTAEQARSAALVPMAPVAPMVPAAPVNAEDKETTDKLKKDLDAANEKIKTLEKQVATLTELLTGKKDSDGSVIPSDPGAVEEIKRLKNRIADLDSELKKLKTQTALKPAIVPEVKPKGIVRVVNEYPVEISMVINDKSHRIAPNTKIDVEIPAGDFSYQLLQSGAPATRSIIKDKETVTLRIK